MADLERVLAALVGVRPSGEGHKACCPAHDDRNASLSINSADDGRILLHCFAGCTFDTIIGAAQIDRADLRGDGQSPGFHGYRTPLDRPRPTPDRSTGKAGMTPPKQPKPPPPRRVRRVGQADYPVKDVDGTLIATKKREDWLLDDGTTEKSCWWKPTLTSLGLAVEDVPLFGSEHVANWPSGTTIVIAEGEKAAQAVLDAGVAAVGTVTGASATPSPASLAILAGYDVVVWPDNDDAGHDHMTAIASRLAELDIGCRWFDWRAAPDKGDAADYLEKGDDADNLFRLLGALDNAPVWAPAPAAPAPAPDAPDAAVTAVRAERDGLRARLVAVREVLSNAALSPMQRLVGIALCFDLAAAGDDRRDAAGLARVSVAHVLAPAVGASPSTVSRAVDGMKQRGLLVKRTVPRRVGADPSDQRSDLYLAMRDATGAPMTGRDTTALLHQLAAAQTDPVAPRHGGARRRLPPCPGCQSERVELHCLACGLIADDALQPVGARVKMQDARVKNVTIGKQDENLPTLCGDSDRALSCTDTTATHDALAPTGGGDADRAERLMGLRSVQPARRTFGVPEHVSAPDTPRGALFGPLEDAGAPADTDRCDGCGQPSARLVRLGDDSGRHWCLDCLTSRDAATDTAAASAERGPP